MYRYNKYSTKVQFENIYLQQIYYNPLHAFKYLIRKSFGFNLNRLTQIKKVKQEQTKNTEDCLCGVHLLFLSVRESYIQLAHNSL